MNVQQRVRLREAANSLGTSVWSLRRWAKAGLLTYYLVGKGGYMEFDVTDVEAFRQSWKRARATPPVD